MQLETKNNMSIESARKTISQRMAAGVCITCSGSELADRFRCAGCAEKNRTANRNRYRKKHGIPLDAPVSRYSKTQRERVFAALTYDYQRASEIGAKVDLPSNYVSSALHCLWRDGLVTKRPIKSNVFKWKLT